MPTFMLLDQFNGKTFSLGPSTDTDIKGVGRLGVGGW